MENKNLKIMIVDDNVDNVMTIRTLIDDYFRNVTIVTSASGQEGIDIATDELPDMIFMEIFMSEMDGFEMCSMIKRMPEIKDIPVVLLTTAEDGRDLKIKAIQVGVEAFLQKPIDPGELVAQIHVMKKIRDAVVERENVHSRLERLVEQRTEQLWISQREAEAAKEAQSRFLANMSHEIRTPLNGIMGMIRLSLDLGLEDELYENLMTAMSSAKSLLRILNDILDYTKIEEGRLTIVNREFEIVQVCKMLETLYLSLAKEKGILFEVVVDDKVPEVIITDEVRLTQILSNLISNGVKFTSVGAVKLFVEWMDMVDDQVQLRFVVSDTGIGIPEDQKEKLFKRFSQLDDSMTKNFEGTGLGLAISKNLTELLGGQLHVNSQEGKGSEFWFELTLGYKQHITKKKLITPEITLKNELQNQQHILVVDDDLVNQKVMKALLEKNHYYVDVASNGLEGVEQFDDNVYDLVLMDISMPVMDGFDAIERMKGLCHDGAANCLFIAMTAFAFDEDRSRCLSRGFDEYLSKPIGFDELLEMIGRLLG